MKTALLLAIVLNSGFAKEPPKDDAAKKEIEKLQGEWIVDHAEKEGKKLTEKERRDLSEFFLTKVVVKDDTVQLWISNKGEEAQGGDASTFQLNVSEKPNRIRINDFRAIYSVTGDKLQVCFKDPASPEKPDEVPTSFDSNMASDWYLFVFKREKK